MSDTMHYNAIFEVFKKVTSFHSLHFHTAPLSSSSYLVKCENVESNCMKHLPGPLQSLLFLLITAEIEVSGKGNGMMASQMT